LNEAKAGLQVFKNTEAALVAGTNKVVADLAEAAEFVAQNAALAVVRSATGELEIA